MSVINKKDTLISKDDYKYLAERIEPNGRYTYHYCSDGEAYIKIFYNPFIMKKFNSKEINGPDGTKKYIYTVYERSTISLTKRDYYYAENGNIIYYKFDECNYFTVQHFFKEILVQNKTNETLSFLQEGQEKITYLENFNFEKLETPRDDNSKTSEIIAARITYANDPITLPQNIEDFELPEQYRNCIFNPQLKGYNDNYDPLTMSINKLEIKDEPLKVLTNAVYEGCETKLILKGQIPAWIYTNLLPLNKKGYITQNEKTYRIVDINNSWYEDVDNWIDLTDIGEIDITYFSNFYVKTVFIEINYKTVIEWKHPFKYYEKGKLNNSIIKYMTPIKSINVDESTIIFKLKDQLRNNFLSTETINGINYTHIYIGDTKSKEFEKLNLSLYSKIKLEIENLRLTNNTNIYFNGGNLTTEKFRVHYYIEGEEKTYDSEAEFRIKNLHLIYGTINNEDNLVSNLNITKEDDKIKLNIETKNLTGECYGENGSHIDNIYITNAIVPERLCNINIVLGGTLPDYLYKEILPLNNKIIDSNGYIIDSNGNEQLKTINALPCSIEGMKIGININSFIDLSFIANQTGFERLYSGEGEDRKMTFFVRKIKLLERFREQSIPFKYYNPLEYYNKKGELHDTEIEYSEETDWSSKMLLINEPYFDSVQTNMLIIPFKDYSKEGLLDSLVTQINGDKQIVLDISNVFNTDKNIEQTKLLFEEGLFFSNGKNGGDRIFFYVEPTFQTENINLRVSDQNGFIMNYFTNDTTNWYWVEKLYLIYNSDENQKIKPLDSREVFKNEGKIQLEKYKIGNYFTHQYDMMYNKAYTTNCIGRYTNIVIKGEIPSWLYEYLPLGEELSIKNDGQLYRTKDQTYKLVSINAIPFPGLSIDNMNKENQCSINLSSMNLIELN